MKPSHPDPTPEDNEKGVQMERKLYGSLYQAITSRKIAAFGKPDAMVITNDGRFFLVEYKFQERFEPGNCGGVKVDFYGHGLPKSQAEKYMRIYRDHKVRTLLYVVEPSGWIFKGWLDGLESKGVYFDTPGTVKTVRRIYPLFNFDEKVRPTKGDETMPVSRDAT